MPRLASPAALLALPLSLSALGCGADGRNAQLDADAPGSDASAIDAGAATDATPGPPAREDFGSAGSGCLDGEDPDEDGLTDCRDSDCSAAPICCIGAMTEACCERETEAPIALAGCDASGCGGRAATIFGAPALDPAFRGTSDAQDAGIVLGTELDGRAGALEARARVALGAAVAPDLDWVAVGFVAGSSGGARVLPAAALQVNAALDRIALVVGETIVASARGVADGEYWVAIDPAGRLTGGRDAETLFTASVVVGAGLHPVVYGRSSVPDGLSVSSLTVARRVCDVPAALGLTPIELVDEALVFEPGTEANPSLARGPDGVLYLAFDAERLDDPGRRSLFVAQEILPGRFVVRNPSTGLPQPIVSLADQDELLDPELSFVGGTWELLFAGERAGVRAVSAARSEAMQPSFPTPEPIDVELPGADSFDAPARVPGTEQIIVRARGADGAFLVRLERTEPLRALMTGEICGVDDACDLGPTSRFVVAPRTGTDRFDADEIASPSLVRDADGLLRLYYTGRRANRWTVTVVISENGDFWRRVSETAGASDEVLGPDDRLGPLGFSSVGTLLEGDALTLVVEGWSGTQGRFSIARQTL